VIFNFASVWVMTIDRRVLKVKVMVKGQCQKYACCTSTYLPAFVLSVLLHSDCVRACVCVCVCGRLGGAAARAVGVPGASAR